MELRLGYLEARDETRNMKDVVLILKREFPDLADVSVLDLCYHVLVGTDVWEVCRHC